MPGNCLIVYVTMPDRDSAETFCETLVHERFAACANILGGASSIYWWRGKLEKTGETVCLFKTTQERFPAFLEKAKKEHPYETPCIAAWPLEKGFPGFLNWIRAETTLR